MKTHSFVFLDAKGRRWLWVRVGIGLALVLALAGLIIFVQALWVRPEIHMPEPLREMKLQLKALDRSANQSTQQPQPWMRFQATRAQQRKPAALPAASENKPQRIAAALLSISDARSLKSLADHATNLTHVCPDLLYMSGQPAVLRMELDSELLSALRASRVPIVPVLSNLNGKEWDTDAVEGLLQADAGGQETFIDNLEKALRRIGAAGVLIDWQGIDPAFSGQMTTFLGRLQGALHAQHQKLWLSIPVADDLRAFDLEHLPDVVDYFVAQLHDQSAEDDAPGPIASQPWFEGWLRTLTAYGDPGQWVISLGAYGYDWNKATHKTAMISFADAMSRAQRAGVGTVTSGAPDYNPGFSYDAETVPHEVWFLDASTLANQMKEVSRQNCGGILLNQLGMEDPGVWPIVTAQSAEHIGPAVLNRLQAIAPGSEIAQIGEGEFLRAEMANTPGHRRMSRDKSGLVTESYLSWPAYPTIIHLGSVPADRVALTFDDGPDPRWTPQILDILKRYNVHATFFVLGRNAEDHPELIQRILREGHEIGSHTYSHPNLSEASPEKITLELNATQRLIEWLGSRSTILFRPPYNADSMPASLADTRPIVQATEAGYITVGESVDPQDWDRPGADEILQRIKHQRGEGNVILLHDAGGDRSQTVEALPGIIEYLLTRGDSIVRAGQLIGLSRGETMPPLAHSEHTAPRLITNAGLWMAHWGEEFLWAAMIVASVLTLARSGLLAVLAIRRRDLSAGGADMTKTPLSVVIAAYNEGKVIEATLRSVLNTDHEGPLEVIVVDDGSSDDTAARAQAVADEDPRVRVLRQANAGKAAALAHGTASARHDIFVFLDADTQFQPDTLGHLVRPFAHRRVGAVSGHARVGNLQSWIARCQGLEYICGFNLDRRAYDAVNAITVVPGAIGAFRRQAINDAGGFATDTLAEDTDLTLCLHRHRWRVTYTPEAIAWTEAPSTLRTLAKQRFRWAFGTMQCLWKHRVLIFNPAYRWLGCFSLPSIIICQILLVAAMPLVDFLLIISLFTGAGWPFVFYFAAFLICDLVLALLACRIEEEPYRRAAWIIPMRFIYRPVLSWVVWLSIFQMLRGAWVGWGKLERTGGVQLPVPESTPS